MPEKVNRLTLQKIADMVGVDKAIVSKVVNGSPKVQVGAAKRRRIEEIVREYNYSPLGAAQSLATCRTRQLAFLLSSSTTMSLANEAFSMMLCGVEAGCREIGYQCQVCVWDFSDIGNFAIPENLKRRSIDGCLLSGSFQDHFLNTLGTIRIPAVALGGEGLRGRLPVLSRRGDREYAIWLEYVKSLGHRRIWLSVSSAHSRRNYREALRKIPGLEVTGIGPIPGRTEFEFAEYQAERFLELPPEKRPTLIHNSDQFCCGFATALAPHGIAVPRDVSLLAYSDTEMGRHYNPPLSSFSQDFYEIGRTGARVLAEIIEQNLSAEAAIARTDREPVESTLVERASVRRLTPPPSLKEQPSTFETKEK